MHKRGRLDLLRARSLMMPVQNQVSWNHTCSTKGAEDSFKHWLYRMQVFLYSTLAWKRIFIGWHRARHLVTTSPTFRQSV